VFTCMKHETQHFYNVSKTYWTTLWVTMCFPQRNTIECVSPMCQMDIHICIGQAKPNLMQNVKEKAFETMWIDKMIKQTKNYAF
jgi:hypothetical protein